MMNESPTTYSIIITVFNKAKHIHETIRSVLGQSYTRFELIIINDGSTDESLKLIQSFIDPRIRVYSQINKGVAAARNLGIERSRYNDIALLDGDDLWQEDFLETIDRARQLYPMESVFATAIAHQYGKKIIPAKYSFTLNGEINVLDFFEHSSKQPILSGSSIVFKKSILVDTGTFKETFRSSEDTDMWINIGLHYRVVFIKSVKAIYRYDDFSLSNSDFNVVHKPRYNEYYEVEKSNLKVKKYIDQNRYSLALMAKLYHENDLYTYYRNELDKTNLSLRKRVLLNCPRWVLNVLLKLKSRSGKKVYYRPIRERNLS